jgi:SAM-dependent methyltransferase
MTPPPDIKTIVRERYADAVTRGSGCCGPSSCGCNSDLTLGLNMVGNAYSQVDGYVAEADLGLGCGLPTRHAAIRPGETVLDLGSGAGIDCFVARREMNGTGCVIGVDMTPEMIARARENAAKLGYDNVEFRLGEIENLPVEAGSVDIVISNCVLNLVPDKAAAFAEMFRVLKAGGRFCVSDIVATSALPAPIREAAALHVGCVAGAIVEAEYLALLGRAGFADVRVVEAKPIPLPDDLLSRYLDARGLEAFRASGTELRSVTVLGSKPASAA